MDDRTYKALEFDKVLEQFARFCLSEVGKQVALQLRPLGTLAEISKAGIVFEETQSWLAESEFNLVSFPDISGALAYIQSTDRLLDEDGMWAIKEVLGLTKQAVLSIQSARERRINLADLASKYPLPELSIAALNRCLGDDGRLRDESSPGLLLTRSEIRSLNQSCLRRVRDSAEKYNIGSYLQGDYMTLASDRYVLPLKANFKGRLQGIIHDYSHTGETLYFEPLFLVEQNNRLQELKQAEREEERKVLRLLSDLLLQEIDEVQAAWNFLVKLDVTMAKCALASAFTGRIVIITPNEQPTLLQARHPLLVLEHSPATRHPAAIKVEPIDIILRPKEHILVISGGNAGGKTVALKTLGLITLMTLSGLPVPVAAGSSLPLWSKVHAFIGDEQSLDDHISTFTGQIQHLAKIWAGLDSDSLVLLDEFGAGTDPSQGAALAQAVLDGILENNAYAVTATHFPALKAYALTRDKVRAASVVFDPKTNKPLYHLAYDQVGASQALTVAREYGLPEGVLRQAEHYLLLDSQDSGVIIDKLNALAGEREAELTALTKERERVKEKYIKMQDRLNAERLRLQEDLRKQSQDLMHAWKTDKATAKQTLKEISKLRASLKTNDDQAEDQPQPLSIQQIKLGDQVRHKPWDKTVVIREIDERGERMKIDMNGVSLWAPVKDLQIISQGQVPNYGRVSTITVNRIAESNPYLALDLRGKRADLALNELEHFLDSSLLSGKDGIEIIHGRGTGALRKSVHQFLKQHPGISQFQLATEDQGGDGVTLATFK